MDIFCKKILRKLQLHNILKSFFVSFNLKTMIKHYIGKTRFWRQLNSYKTQQIQLMLKRKSSDLNFFILAFCLVMPLIIVNKLEVEWLKILPFLFSLFFF